MFYNKNDSDGEYAMKKEYEDFLLSEYGNSRIEPTKISLDDYDFIVPYSYANPLGNYDAFEKDLFGKYIQNQTKELKKYADNGYRKIPTLRFQDIRIVCPYRLRNLSLDEAKHKVAAEINTRYNKAIRLTMALNEIYPNNKLFVNVDADNVKKLSEQYNNYLLHEFEDKALVSAAKMNQFVKQKLSLLRGAFKHLSAPIFQSMNKHYIKHLTKFKAFWNRNSSKLTVALGATTLAGALTLIAYKNSKGNSTKERENSVQIDTSKNISQTKGNTDPKNTTSTLKGFDALDKNVQEFLKNKGLGKEKLNAVQKHNLNVFIKTQKDFKLFVAFAENFYASAIDDNKGFATLGYGCTNYLNEKGEPLEKCGNGGKMSAFVQMGQTITKSQAMEQVERVSNFSILPKILESVKVKLDENKMFVTKNFAYVANKQFESSKFVEALNNRRSNKYLSQCLALWNVDAGIPKRFFMLHLVLNNHLTPKDFIKFRPVSCYNLTLDQCLVCRKNPDGSTKTKKLPVVTTEVKKGRLQKITRYQTRPDYVMQNGMPQFTDDPKLITLYINSMRAKPNEKCVANIVPASIIPEYNVRKGKKQDYLALSFQQKRNNRES